MAYEYKLPSLGEGVTGKVTEIMVKPGDKVTKDQIVMVVGTDKVDAEMPVDADGTVEEVAVKVGDDVTEGMVILRLQAADGAAAPAAAAAAPAGGEPKAAAPTPQPVATPEVPAPPPAPATPAPAPAPVAEAATSQPGQFRVSPLARKRAKEFGVTLSDVRPTDGSSRISYRDVVDFVKKKIDTGGGAAVPAGSAAIKIKPLPNFEKFGA
ncbi:MAG: E3 binding domain-containing protein, partial [Saprospiraceae bacterium]|nr:E3 binding domain-containing protein [Saprospiraceae bacterium]